MTIKNDLLQLVGTSPAVESVREEIAYASRSDAKILITGESGVGKEVVARLIHSASLRKHNPLVTVNCAALTESLLETELFGHVRGSFTGAFRDRCGVLEQANRGTAFMDEIGETTPRMQGLLLRFLETGEIQRVGSDRPDTRVDVRVIAATNRDLLGGVAEKTFREDLYYRLNVIHMRLPPLRERREDIQPLLSRFLTDFSAQYEKPQPALSPEAVEMLATYRWPGNVRELKNVAERLVVRSHGGQIGPEDLPIELLRVEAAPPATGVPAARSSADVLFDRMVVDRQSFWSVVYAPFMSRDLTRDDLRAIVRKGLEQTAGSYRVLTELFNMPADDYKRFLNFLRKHHCHMAFQPFRSAAGSLRVSSARKEEDETPGRRNWSAAAAR